jgi:hypothetical protein
MAVAVPRSAPAPSRRRRPSAPRPVERTATRRRARPRAARASVGGRLAPFRIGLVVALLGAFLFLIVYLHAQSLQATMEAGALRTQIEAANADAANIQAETEQRLADGRVERAAAAYGMVLVPSEALRTLSVDLPEGDGTR